MAKALLSRDAPLTVFLLTVMTSTGAVYINFLPVIVEGLQTGVGFTALQAGFVGSANMYGGAAGSLVAALFAAKIQWKRTIAVTLVALATIDFLSMFVTDYSGLLAIRFVHGLVAGVLIGAGFIVISRTKAPDRAFGTMLLVQFAQSGAAIVVLPTLLETQGVWLMFAVMMAISAVTLLVLPLLPAYEPREDQLAASLSAPKGFGSFPTGPLFLAAFAGIFLCQMSRMAGGAYALGIGHFFGMTTQEVSDAVGVTTWIACLGALAPVLLGARFGRFHPILWTTVFGVLVTAALSLWGQINWVFWVTNALGGLFGLAGLPYYFGVCAALDPTGRSSTWTGFFSKVGLASGPAIGGIILDETHFQRLIWISLIIGVVSAIASGWPALKLDKAAQAEAAKRNAESGTAAKAT